MYGTGLPSLTAMLPALVHLWLFRSSPPGSLPKDIVVQMLVVLVGSWAIARPENKQD